MKTYVQGFTFHRLPGAEPVIFASRAALGLADGFEREVQPTDADGDPIPGPPIDRRRSAGQRAFLRRRRYDDSRLRARQRGRARTPSARMVSRPAATPCCSSTASCGFRSGGRWRRRLRRRWQRLPARDRIRHRRAARLRTAFGAALPLAGRPDPCRPRLQDGSQRGRRSARAADGAPLQPRAGFLIPSRQPQQVERADGHGSR